MASGAGLNRVGFRGGKEILTCGVAGTFDSGIVMSEAMAFSKWAFQIIPTPTQTAAPSGWSVTFYGTIDPAAFDLYEEYNAGGWTTDPRTLLPATSWCQIVAPSPETATGDTVVWYNPITASGQHLYTPVPWVAVRAVAVGTSINGTAITVLAFAIP